MIKKESNKNGLVELFRFLCSVWVAYFHGFSPILSEKFDGVNISVDFFFMVTGLFFLQSIEKYRERPFIDGLRFIFFGRTKRFIIPLIIAALSILWCNTMIDLTFNDFNFPFSFLWFFAAQFLFLTLYYLLLKNTKRRSTFNIACAFIICFSVSFFKFDIQEVEIIARAPAMLAIGMLVSQIPKIKIKAEKLTLMVNIIGFSISAIAFVYLAYLPEFAIWKLHLFACVVCPLLLYFATALPVRSKFLNLLGELSVFIYLAQCPILLHYFYVSQNTKDQFPLLCICTVVMFVINRLANRKKAFN